MSDTRDVIYHYRVCKYDPAKRDAGGGYKAPDWTSFEQVGTIVSMADYLIVEQRYCDAALALLSPFDLHLVVKDLAGPWGKSDIVITSGQSVGMSELSGVLRELLRGRYWCRLEAAEAFIHVGWDFYMYIGVPIDLDRARPLVEAVGLFCEEFESPYIC